MAKKMWITEIALFFCEGHIGKFPHVFELNEDADSCPVQAIKDE